MIDANGQWYPSLSPKQIEVYNDPRKHILLSGPRACGKTIVAIHKAIKHAWLNNNDRVGIFVKSTKVGKTGIWDDLITYALPEWERGMGDQGFKITVPPSVDGATRMHYVRIANRWGGESEMQLHPLHHEDSVNEKMRGSRFGALLFDEVDNYDDPEVFNISTMQLRQIGLPENKHLWIGTTNPAGDTSHWLYQKFFTDINDPTFEESYRRTFATFEFKLSDNPFLSPDTITKLKMIYRNDPDMYKRYVEGLWVPDSRSTHFAGVFLPNQHVKGDYKEGTQLFPSDGCAEVFVGWDIGDRNHAIIFLEHVITTSGDYWAVIDEIVHIGKDVSIEALTREAMDKIKEITDSHGKPLVFRHWSDKSAFDRYRSAADARDHIIVHHHSGGKIELRACPKPQGSVMQRIGLVRKMLIENRLFFSAHCLSIVDAMRLLSKGKNKGEHIKHDRHVHPFDALTYVLYGEAIEELENAVMPRAKLADHSRFSL